MRRSRAILMIVLIIVVIVELDGNDEIKPTNPGCMAKCAESCYRVHVHIHPRVWALFVYLYSSSFLMNNIRKCFFVGIVQKITLDWLWKLGFMSSSNSGFGIKFPPSLSLSISLAIRFPNSSREYLAKIVRSGIFK